MNDTPHITITSTDLGRLQRLVDCYAVGRYADAAELLERELSRAVCVADEELAANIVSMNSTVVFEDEESKTRQTVTLCFPNETGPGRVSVLAPVGSALLGLSVGQTIQWPMPSGRSRTLRVIDVPSQPPRAVANTK